MHRLNQDRDGWWLTLDGKRRRLDREPDRDGEWLICASNGQAIRVHGALAVENNWAWTWIVGSVMIPALLLYVLGFVVWGELTRRSMKLAMLLVICGAAVGCTQAGPFVTNVSTAGPNKVLIEKCHVHMNAFMGTISNDQCTTHELQLQTH